MYFQLSCPSCSSKVSALATSCPTCGFPVVLYTSMTSRREALGHEPLELIAMNPHTPLVILEMLRDIGGPSVRSSLTRNPRLTEMIQYQLSDDRATSVRVALASSPFTTNGVMEKLSCDADREVISALCQNDATPEYIRTEIESLLDDTFVGEDDVRDYNDYNDDDVYHDDDYYEPYQDGVIEHDGKYYDVMDLSEYGYGVMYFDEDNGWLTDLP